MCILDLSKILMYEFHYDYIKKKYGSKSRPSFTDTGTLMYQFKAQDVYEDFSKGKGMFDSSNYLSKPKYFGDSSKLVVAKVREEKSGVAMEEFFK